MKKIRLIVSAFVVFTLIGTTFAISPKGNTIYCALSSQEPCDIAVFGKGLTPFPTTEVGWCVTASQSKPCPMIFINNEP